MLWLRAFTQEVHHVPQIVRAAALHPPACPAPWHPSAGACDGNHLTPPQGASAEAFFDFLSGHEEAFVVDPALNEAHLVTPFRVYDRVSQTSLDLAVDLTWRAMGSRADLQDRSPIEIIAFNVTRKLHGEGHPAEATGVLRHPDGFDVLLLCAFGGPCEPVPSRSAQLMLLKHGQVTLTQNAY